MKTKPIILLTLTLIILTIIPSIVYADVIIPGTKSISWCYEISNMEDYPDYVFLLHGKPMMDYKIVEPDECFSFYKFTTVSIYAVEKSKFNENELKEKNYTEIENYFTNNPNVIPSDIQLGSYSYRTVKENDPLEKAVTTLQIISLTGNNLHVQKSKITYTYTDGTFEEKPFQVQDVIPEPSKKAIIPWWFAEFWYIILPVLAAAIIAAILLSRRLKK